MKIAITGGHFGVALGVIDLKNKEDEIIFIGRKYFLDQEKTLSLEYLEVTKRGIEFYPIEAGRLTRLASVRTLINFLKIPVGFFQAYKILNKVRPDVVLSFGSYVALPVCIVGFLMGIPIFTHEQTISPGIANKIITFISKNIFVSFEDAGAKLPNSKVIVSGNPVRNHIRTVLKKPFKIIKDRPVIYFTGGSLGSHSVNLIAEKLLTRLLEEYVVIHQTGSIKEYGDFQRLSLLKKRLPEALKDNYFLKEHFFQDEIGYVYSICDIVVGRSGANTFFELLALKKPAVFIPLPWSGGKEQMKHAELFQKNGCGEILHQSDEHVKLLELIKKILLNYQVYKSNFKNLEKLYREDAAKIILKTIKESVEKV